MSPHVKSRENPVAAVVDPANDASDGAGAPPRHVECFGTSSGIFIDRALSPSFKLLLPLLLFTVDLLLVRS